jgi:hypothetical protein
METGRCYERSKVARQVELYDRSVSFKLSYRLLARAWAMILVRDIDRGWIDAAEPPCLPDMREGIGDQSLCGWSRQLKPLIGQLLDKTISVGPVDIDKSLI